MCDTLSEYQTKIQMLDKTRKILLHLVTASSVVTGSKLDLHSHLYVNIVMIYMEQIPVY